MSSDTSSDSQQVSNLSDESLIDAVLSEHKPSKNPAVRGLWIFFGSIFVVFGIIGILVPGWPTTSWIVLAAYCYARSSQSMFRWLLTNRVFGGALLDYYRAGRALPLHSKIFICGFILIVSAFSIWGLFKAGDPGFGQTLIAIVAIIGVWFVSMKVPTAD